MQTFRLGAPPVVTAFHLGCPGFNGFIEGAILNSVIAEVTKVGVQNVHLPCSRLVPMGRFFLFASVLFSGNVCMLALVPAICKTLRCTKCAAKNCVI